MQQKILHEEATTSCKSECCFIPHVINTQWSAYLEFLISHRASTSLHRWRNSSLSSKRKSDQREIFLLVIGTARHITQFFTLLWAERALFSLPLPILVIAWEYGGNFSAGAPLFLLISLWYKIHSQRVQRRPALLDAWIATDFVMKNFAQYSLIKKFPSVGWYWYV